MIVSLKKNPKKKYFVYAIYWGDSNQVKQRLHYIVDLEENIGGFIPLSESEVIIVDNIIDNYVLADEDLGVGDVFVHQAALPLESLFNEIADGGYSDGVEQLYRNMRKMGLDPEPK